MLSFECYSSSYITRTSRFFVGHRPLTSTLTHMTHSSSSIFAYCKQSKTEGGKGLGTRLQNYGTFSRSFPESIFETSLRLFLESILGTFLKTRVHVPVIALWSKHRDTVVKMRNDPAYTNSLFLSCLAFHSRQDFVLRIFLCVHYINKTPPLPQN